MDSSLLPTERELLATHNPECFPNIIKGEFPNVSAYLDIHYSLLREDFCRPVREAIAAYKKNPGNSVDNLRIFPNVQFGEVRKIIQDVGIEVQFSSVTCDDEDWESSKTFMKGSLLIFTNDNFKSYVLGTVLHRSISDLKRGVVTVQLHDQSPYLFSLRSGHYLMAECETFFLPYYNVMRVLTSIDDKIFPFHSELIFAYKLSFLPQYLNDLTEYVMPNGKTSLVIDMSKVRPEELDLNESQLSAVKCALQKRIALIQGPPGTGKTHVASKIAEILIKNSHVWNANKKTPLLIVSASNQALDQLAERLLKFTNEIIRVGEQSKSKLLADYNLNVILRRGTGIDSEKIKQTPEMKKRHKEMKLAWEELNRFAEGINRTRSLGDVDDYVCNALRQLEKIYSHTVSLFKQERQQVLQSVLSKAKVLAMTTTRAAQMNEVLHRIKPPIVIVEEAAEMFEAHVLGCLTKYCLQLILIGDHQQLRPIAAHPEFARQTNLDVSLFERLINNNVGHEKLKIQHRTRIEIADLLRACFYKDLCDHPSAVERRHIAGMRKNLFFVTHHHRETKHPVLSGYTNQTEAVILLKWVQYLISKGHRTEDMTILTPYTLQVRLIRKIQKKSRPEPSCAVTTIDGFQGQENKIIIISWVRNGNGIGFLGSENRICVALSRARDGLYMIGDAPLLMEKSPTWRKIGNYLESKDSIGEAFPIAMGI